MRGWLAVVLGLVLVSVPSALADKDVHEFRVIAHNDAANCVEDAEPCLEMPFRHGLIEDTDRVRFTFENNGTQSHSLLVAPGEAADPANGTSPEDAFLSLGPIEPGQTAGEAAEVPNGTETLHVFCGVDDHEETGAHLSRNVHPGGSVQEAENETIGDPGQGTPVPAWTVLAGLALAAIVGYRRR